MQRFDRISKLRALGAPIATGLVVLFPWSGGLSLAPLALAQSAAEEPVKTVTEAENIPNQAEQAPSELPSLPLNSLPLNSLPVPPNSVPSRPALTIPTPALPSAERALPPAENVPNASGGLFERPPRPTPRTTATSPEPLGMTLANTADRHVRVHGVQARSAAAQAGVRPGDQLVSFAGQPIESDEQLVRTLADLRTRRTATATENLPLIVQRDGNLLTLQVAGEAVARGERPLRDVIANRPRVVRRIPQTLTRDQDRTRANTDELRADRGYLGVELDPRYPQAAIVARVLPGSAAAQAGLQAGDRIFAINQEPIATSAELVSWIAELNPGEAIDIKFDRPQTAHVTLGPRPTGGAGERPAVGPAAVERTPSAPLTIPSDPVLEPAKSGLDELPRP